MKKSAKYDVSGLPEAQFEPGSRKTVLKNLLEIKNKNEMDRLEAIALKRAEDLCFRTYDIGHRFSSMDICKIHQLWLQEIYPWAGHYRQVNISKGSFHFASAGHIPQLMVEFEKEFLSVNTPCHFKTNKDLVQALAEVHTEIVLIHPFREGNGRIARLLATIMALQAGRPPLNFSHIKGRKKLEYFAAVQAGMEQNYKPMAKIFGEILELTISG